MMTTIFNVLIFMTGVHTSSSSSCNDQDDKEHVIIKARCDIQCLQTCMILSIRLALTN